MSAPPIKRFLAASALAGLCIVSFGTPALASAPEPPPSCICTTDYRPVVGVDGKTYSNACQAGCAGVAVDHEVGETSPIEPSPAPSSSCPVPYGAAGGSSSPR